MTLIYLESAEMLSRTYERDHKHTTPNVSRTYERDHKHTTPYVSRTYKRDHKHTTPNVLLIGAKKKYNTISYLFCKPLELNLIAKNNTKLN